jgi:hypothetical protein
MMARTKMQKAIVFLLSIAIVAVLTLVQRLYLPHRDTGKQWAVMEAWFGLCAWFLHKPEPESAASRCQESQKPERSQSLGDPRANNLKLRTGQRTDRRVALR